MSHPHSQGQAERQWTFADVWWIFSVEEEEIESQTEALRKKLMTGNDAIERTTGRAQFKPHQVHELAAAKIEESEKLRRVLGIREDYEEGSHWKKQEERMRDGIGAGVKEER